MKIENIIEDIIEDTIELKNNLEERMKKEYPGFNFTIELPGLKELSAIKVIQLSFFEDNNMYRFCVDLHTQNGNRVFEQSSHHLNESIVDPRHPMQDNFINLLREIIKKRKIRAKAGSKSTSLYKDIRDYARQR